MLSSSGSLLIVPSASGGHFSFCNAIGQYRWFNNAQQRTDRWSVSFVSSG